jgi:hypothetical protein
MQNIYSATTPIDLVASNGMVTVLQTSEYTGYTTRCSEVIGVRVTLVA